MDAEVVVSALQVLNGVADASEKRAADVWLRRWQQSESAWVTANAILNNPSMSFELHYLAASTLRTKIMYDLNELATSDCEDLLQSIVSHILTFKHATFKAILTSLTLSVGDLALHLAEVWEDPIGTMITRLSGEEDRGALVLCLKSMAEELYNRRLLVSGNARDLHYKKLTKSSGIMSQLLLQTLEAAVARQDADLVSLTVSCFTEWLNTVGRELLGCAVPILRQATELLKAEDTSPYFETGVACLTDVLSYLQTCPDGADRVGTVSQVDLPVFEYLVAEMTQGAIHRTYSRALEEQNWESVNQLAYPFVKLGKLMLGHLVVNDLATNESLQSLMAVLIVLTNVSYDEYDLNRGPEGIAALAASQFWPRYCSVVSLYRTLLKAKAASENLTEVLQEYEGWNPTLRNMLHRSVSQIQDASGITERQDLVLNNLLSTVLEQSKLQSVVTSRGDRLAVKQPFFDYRYKFSRLLKHLAEASSKDVVLERLLASWSLVASGDDVISKEAHLYLLQYSILTCSGSTTTLARISELISQLLLILSQAPSTSELQCYLKAAAAFCIGHAAADRHLKQSPESIQSILNALAEQLSLVTLEETSALDVTAEDSEAPLSQRSHHESAESYLVNSLCMAFAHVTKHCEFSSSATTVSALVDAVSTKFIKLRGSSYEYLLEGVQRAMLNVTDDAVLTQLISSLLGNMIKQLRESGDTCMWLDRFVVFFRTYCRDAGSQDYASVDDGGRSRSHGLSSAGRNCIARVIIAELWPIIAHLLKERARSSIIVEKACRVLKHGMRCVGGKRFAPVVGAMSEVLTQLAKNGNMNSSFLYAAEWLITEYSCDATIREYLAGMFDCFGAIALREIGEAIERKELNDLQEMIEDCYGMFCRYFNFCPLIPALSVNLEQAVACCTACLRVPKPQVNVVITGFIKTLARNITLPEEGEADEVPAIAQALEDAHIRVKSLFVANLDRFVNELFLALADIPGPEIVANLMEVLEEFAFECSRDAELQQKLISDLENAFQTALPANAVSEKAKEALLKATTEHSAALRELLKELYHRVQQISLRRREAGITAEG